MEIKRSSNVGLVFSQPISSFTYSRWAKSREWKTCPLYEGAFDAGKSALTEFWKNITERDHLILDLVKNALINSPERECYIFANTKY